VARKAWKKTHKQAKEAAIEEKRNVDRKLHPFGGGKGNSRAKGKQKSRRVKKPHEGDHGSWDTNDRGSKGNERKCI